MIRPRDEHLHLPYGDWVGLPSSDLIVSHLNERFLEHKISSTSWELARFSKAVYLYREASSKLSIIVKFYSIKTKEKAEHWVNHEYENIEFVSKLIPAGKEFCVVSPFFVWQGAIFLDYVDGLTLGDIIVVRRSRPGLLASSLQKVASFLANLHQDGQQLDREIYLTSVFAYADEIVNNLSKIDIFKSEIDIINSLAGLIERWLSRSVMKSFIPSYVHGDTTTTNFIFSADGRLVIIDWEYFTVADPAADFGRFVSEVTHVLHCHGAGSSDMSLFIRLLVDSYFGEISNKKNVDFFLERVRFYRAINNLRMARNHWLSQLERSLLLTESFSLLSYQGNRI